MREVKVGDTARRSMLVTDEQIELFARLSGDRNPLHFDEDFARKTKFGRRVVHGGVTAAILNALVAADLPGPEATSTQPPAPVSLRGARRTRSRARP